MIKLCKDCKHFKEYNIPMDNWRYQEPECIKSGERDLVYGTKLQNCFFERIINFDEKACGKEGKFWEFK